MSKTATYVVPDISSGHCRAVLETEVGAIPGVEAVDVDLEATSAVVKGTDVDDTAIRAAIYRAGYEAQ